MIRSSLRHLTPIFTAALLLNGAAARAQHDHDHSRGHGHSHDQPSAPATVKAEVATPSSFTAGRDTRTVLRLTSKDGKPITPDQLQVAHTEKLHLLIVDETLTDYHHEHPVPGEKPGEYAFDFAPRFGGTYAIWADVVPTATGQQEYAVTQVKVSGAPARKDRTLNTTADASGFRFTMSTENDAPLVAGKATLVKVKVSTPDGKPFDQLEPVMGAFAHMVAFPEDAASVTHVHPMGREPETPTERGGPELSFHVQPDKAGFLKIFLQTQIGGQEVYAAFAQNVEAGSATGKSAASEYTCPMHPEVKQKTPGKCPDCGMALEAVDSHDHKHGHDHKH
jgi:hypothetical protein